MNNESCVSCNFSNVNEVVYSGYFTFEGYEYPLKTKYLKCSDCTTEFIGKSQIKENQEYISSVKLNREKVSLQ